MKILINYAKSIDLFFEMLAANAISKDLFLTPIPKASNIFLSSR